jgi:hypothetical protein
MGYWKGGYRPTKAIARLHYAITIPFVVCFLFGMIYFPHAPFRQVGFTYVDKLGQPHTAEYYRLWEWWTLAATITGICFAFLNIYSVIDYYCRKGARGDGADPKKPQSEEV